MFKIDTRVKDKEGNLKEGGQIALNLTDLLKQLFDEEISSSTSFDKKAKKLIRSQYKILTDNRGDKTSRNEDKYDRYKSEHKEGSRMALVATNGNDNIKDGPQTVK